ncbi:degenerin-like protein unc-105 [Ptychodera flava]|uniref:degenerin-like protein unc-105 n=1 Tax=Ptychodera flava TaxID=63121 RepID=UPI003969F725
MFSESPDLSQLTGVLQLSVDEISELGHQAEDFILQCTYAGEKCDAKNDFIVSQDQRFGNCFHFNGDQDKPRLSTGPGPDQGLTLTLFTEQDEYLSIYGQDSAAVVGITPPGSQYFPVDQGFFALPGTVTAVSLSMSKLNRQSYPFGNCTNQIINNGIDDRVAAMYMSGQYSLAACEKACLQNALVVYCGCTDTLGIRVPPCRMLNETQVVCKQLIYYLYQKDLLQCHCPPPCSETTYDMTISQSQWPSHAYLNNLLKLVQVSNKKTQNMHNLESARANLVRLKIYFETLNHDLTSELPAYTWEDLLSDVGGTLGLYVGFSVITVCEFVTLLFNLCGKVRRFKKKTICL